MHVRDFAMAKPVIGVHRWLDVTRRRRGESTAGAQTYRSKSLEASWPLL